MKNRKLFYRKKGKATVISGKHNGITTDILTLPNPNKLIDKNFDLVSFISKEKMLKIIQKIECLDINDKSLKKEDKEVPI